MGGPGISRTASASPAELSTLRRACCGSKGGQESPRQHSTRIHQRHKSQTLRFQIDETQHLRFKRERRPACVTISSFCSLCTSTNFNSRLAPHLATACASAMQEPAPHAPILEFVGFRDILLSMSRTRANGNYRRAASNCRSLHAGYTRGI